MSNNGNTVLGILAGTAIGATLGIHSHPIKEAIPDSALVTKRN